MKDGRPHLAHKTELEVDLDTGVGVRVTVQAADRGDATSVIETLTAAAEQVEAILPNREGIQKRVAG